jgi:hypothetical protein
MILHHYLQLLQTLYNKTMYIPFSYFGSTLNTVYFKYYTLVTCAGGCLPVTSSIAGVVNVFDSINNQTVYDTINNVCTTAITSSNDSASIYFTELSQIDSVLYGVNGCDTCQWQNYNQLNIPSGCIYYNYYNNNFNPGTSSVILSYVDCTGSAVTSSVGFYGRFNRWQLNPICAQTKPLIQSGSGLITKLDYDCNKVCYPNQIATDGLVLLLVSSSYTASTGIWRDISGNCNDAFVSSSINPVIWNTNLSSSEGGWQFNPNYSQSLQFPSTLNATPSSSFTIQMWISSSYGFQKSYALFGKGGRTTNGWNSYFDGYIDPNNRPEIHFLGDTISGLPEVRDYQLQIGISEGFMAYAVDATTGTAYLYNSSGEIAETVGYTPIYSFTGSSQPLRFGYNDNIDLSYFSGSVKGLAIYNRFLSEDELWYNYINSTGSINFTEVACSHSVQPQLPPNFPPFPISGSLIVRNTLISNSGSIWYDVSGNGNNALVSGSTLSLSGSLGYEFNGTNNYLTYPEPLSSTPSGSWTLQWYGTMYNDSVARDLYCKDFYNDGWDIIYNGTGSLTYRDQSGADKSIAITNVSATKTLWTLVGNDTANSIVVYKNGTSVGTMSAGAVNSFNASGTPFKFGFNTNTDATYFKGTIAELLVYNKGLSAGEVSTTYTYLNTYFP